MPDTTQFATVFGQLEATAGDCDRTADSVTANLAALRGYVASLAELWLGKASLAYVELMQQFDKNGNDLVGALHAIAGGLRANEANYSHGETMNVSVINNAAAAVPLPAINL